VSEQQTLAYRGTSPEDIRFHYDLDTDFYALWGDANRAYSCALWEEGDTLEIAQLRKIDYFIEQTRAAGAQRVLDIGCGWGAMLRRLVETHGVEHAVGLTLSQAQLDHINGMALPRAEARLENWFDHQPSEPYDAIISVGAFEHFVARTSRTERLAAYRAFFQHCHDWLRPGGRLGLQTMAVGHVAFDHQRVRDYLFISERIFPGSMLGRPHEILEASEQLFHTLSVRVDTDHYVRTYQEWLDRLRANWDRSVAVAGEEKTADFERALALAVQYFGDRSAVLLRLIFERV
jgi:cyclopropane-fatty-acyl-phospholipid synthase